MLMLVDAPGLWYRAFYGVPSSMRGPDGTQINAVRGFCDGLSTLIRNQRPTGLVCAIDANWRPDWRVELLPSYKAHRVAADGGEEEPDALGPQVEIIMELLRCLGIATVGSTGFEADDVLATLAAGHDGPVEVVTGDRDLFQLVDDDQPVRVIYIGRGIAKAETYDEAAVRQRFGVRADQYADFAVLRGDASDGLPGVKGVGDKTAAKLITEYGDLATLLGAAADPASSLTPRVRGSLIDAADYLAVAPKVVRTVADVPVPKVDTDLPETVADEAGLSELTQKYGLANPVTRFGEAVAENPAT
ncbi:5'-3' exonuclease [Stackebrandtia endophytica]|uniref:5'-3' exonuclease n=1 Tax=Stackebrandtia endophytica TaxID=1496996 RepID=A0A543AQ00_9ACTN|nr:5'-3' exonuclease [Stackebrandtia endophytica]TQL74650.1 5'-3' exonuclease [Stackebrandtia endophytica]